MVEQLQKKLKQLDQNMVYPVLHSKKPLCSSLSEMDADELRGMTPYLKRVILQILKTEG
jgi:hypothetical protein